jgi:SAM-dependent methyltransferase
MNRYDEVARLYDSYVTTDHDLSFLRDRVRRAEGRVLELMSGTGRVSIAVADVAADRLVCIDLSLPMLEVSREKAARLGAPIDLVGADIRRLPLADASFVLIMVPFNSFSELLTPDDRATALAEIARCLRPRGAFICTLHNPRVRTGGLDGVPRELGRFPSPDGSGYEVEVRATGSLDSGTGLALSEQEYRTLDASGRLVGGLTQVVRFSLIEADELDRACAAASLRLDERFGDYSGAPYDPEASPFIISVFRTMNPAAASHDESAR